MHQRLAATRPIPEPDQEDWDRFWSLVRNYGGEGCWTFVGPINAAGYGIFWMQGASYRAHRISYAWSVGDTMATLDHTCHDPLVCHGDSWECPHRRCVNPEHLDPVSRGENVRRGRPGSELWHPVGNSLRTHCVNGHEFTPENTYVDPKHGWRQCRICKTEAALRSQDARRDEINARRRARRVRKTYEPRACAECGARFVPDRSTARYCSKKCKWRAENHQRRSTSS